MNVSNDNDVIYFIYVITRDDGKVYVGTTNSKRLYHRMCHHKYSTRFRNHSFTYEIVAAWKTSEVFEYEEYFIQKYDSFLNGLNRSKDGKGNHLSAAFSTLGWKMSEETKRKIGEKSKRARKAKGHKFSAEVKARLSEKRKGKFFGKRKFALQFIDQIYEHYQRRPHIQKAGKVQPNGRLLSYERAFANQYASVYGMTSTYLYMIITNQDKSTKKEAA